MKKVICVIFLCLIAGCMGPTEYSNPHLDAVKVEGQLLNEQAVALTEEINTYNQTVKYFQQLQNEFMGKLSVEELTAYERLCSTPIDNVPQTALNQRLLLDMLSEENTTTYWAFVQEGAEFAEQVNLLNQKLKAYNERLAKHHQNVQLGIELVKIQMQQSQQQSQQYWQNYNNQQQTQKPIIIQRQQPRTNNFGQIIDNVGRTLPYKY